MQSKGERHDESDSKIPLDHILFKGGTNLTMFQSVGLLSIGLAFILFIGLPIFLWQLWRPEQRNIQAIVAGATMTLWGVMMVGNGIAAILRHKKRKRLLRAES